MNYLSIPGQKPPVVELKATVKGRYKMEAVREDGTRRLLAGWFDNLVTNNGLDLLATNANWAVNCLVGSGNTAPTNSDTTLVSFVAATNATPVGDTSSVQSSPPYFGTSTRTYRFAIGVATGNLSEVGIGPNNTNSSLFSRALILDGGGSPTTITVLSSEALDVTYQLQQYVPTVDVTGTVTINAVSYAYTARAAQATGSTWAIAFTGDTAGINAGITVYNGTIGAVTALPSGSSASSGAVVVGSYTSGTKHIDSTVSFSLTQGNVSSGISAVAFNCGVGRLSMGAYQVGFTPSLPKDSSHTMTLVFRQSWDRH